MEIKHVKLTIVHCIAYINANGYIYHVHQLENANTLMNSADCIEIKSDVEHFENINTFNYIDDQG